MTVEKLLTQWGEECLHAQSKYNRQTIVEVAFNVLALSETWMQKADRLKRQYGGGNAVLLLYPKNRLSLSAYTAFQGKQRLMPC